MANHLFQRFDPRLAEDLKSQRGTLIKGLLCTAVTSLLTAGTIWLTRYAVGAIESAQNGDEEALSLLARLCVGVVGVYAIKFFFTRGQWVYLNRAANRLANDLRLKLFDKLQRLPVSYFHQKRSGAIQSVLTNDVNIYQTAVIIVRDSIDGPLKAIAALAAVFIIQWRLGVMALVIMPFMFYAIQANNKRIKVAQKNVQDDLAAVNAFGTEALQGVRVVKAFASENQIQAIYRRLVENSFGSQIRAANLQAIRRPLVEVIGACGLALVLYMCGRFAYERVLHISDITAVALALDTVNQGWRNIDSVNNTYTQVQAASERIYSEVLGIPEEHSTSQGTLIPDKVVGRWEFQDVSFRYPDGTSALCGVSFAIEPGTSVALVGPSGAGKSTIADLMLRFYDPTEGTITLDGVDIRQLDTAWLRSQFGVVPQQTFLFAGTLADNIRLGNQEATEDEVQSASVSAFAADFIDQTPEKLATLVGERGARLSGGEMQRIAIARALVRNPKFLLLDEATSALDAISEKKVQEALDKMMQSRTTLFIAHRLTTAARATKIVVLRGGEVVETGSHSELLAANGTYAGMVKTFSHEGFLGEA